MTDTVGVPDKWLHASFSFRMNQKFLPIAIVASELGKWCMKRLPEKKRNDKTAIMHHVIQLRLSSLIRNFAKGRLMTWDPVYPFLINIICRSFFIFLLFQSVHHFALKSETERRWRKFSHPPLLSLPRLHVSVPTAKNRARSRSRLSAALNMCRLWLVWPSENCWRKNESIFNEVKS